MHNKEGVTLSLTFYLYSAPVTYVNELKLEQSKDPLFRGINPLIES